MGVPKPSMVQRKSPIFHGYYHEHIYVLTFFQPGFCIPPVPGCHDLYSLSKGYVTFAQPCRPLSATMIVPNKKSETSNCQLPTSKCSRNKFGRTHLQANQNHLKLLKLLRPNDLKTWRVQLPERWNHQEATAVLSAM